VNQFYKDRDEFYLARLTDQPPPKIPQTMPMSIGSAFDAFVKHHLVKCLYGTIPAEFEIDALLETQVEAHNRPWAREHGYHVFQQYKHSGALAKLMLELEQASALPRFEFTVEKRVVHETNIAGVPLLGKPDVFFYRKVGAPMILDWKVNGYCAKGKTSPRVGYIHYLDGWDHAKKPASRNHGHAHHNALPMMSDGLMLNVATTLDDVNLEWAQQLSIYLWVLGENVGTDAIVGIDQLCGQEADSNVCTSLTAFTDIGVAQHRCKISKKFQLDWFAKIAGAWQILQSGHIFNDLTRPESDEKCHMLDEQWKAFQSSDQSPEAQKNQAWYNKMMGRAPNE
jgi:hypothetical protein